MGEKDPAKKKNRQANQVTGEFRLIDPVMRQMRRTSRSAHDRRIEELGVSEGGASKIEEKPQQGLDEENH